MNKDKQCEINVLTNLSQVTEQEWDDCACPEGKDGRPIDPFTTYRFLKALEDSNSVGHGTGWIPHYLQAKLADETIGISPLYVKTHSQVSIFLIITLLMLTKMQVVLITQNYR